MQFIASSIHHGSWEYALDLKFKLWLRLGKRKSDHTLFKSILCECDCGGTVYGPLSIYAACSLDFRGFLSVAWKLVPICREYSELVFQQGSLCPCPSQSMS